MRSIMVLLLGLLGGLFMMWAFRQGMRPTALLRLPRAFTDIIRSKPAAAGPAAAAAPRAAAAGAAPAAKGGASAAAGKRKAAAAAAAALEEGEEAEAAAEAKAKAKPARRGGASSRKATKAVEEEEEEEEEAEEEAAAAEAEEEEVEEAKPVKQTAAQKRAAAAKKGGAKAPAAAAAPAAAEDAKPKKISRRNLGKEKGKEPNPAGFVDPKTGKLPAAGAAGVAIPPAPVSEPDGPSSLPRKTIVPAKARPALPKVFKSEGDIPEFCEGPERFPEEPVEWHIVEEEEIDREAYPCHLANVTHWALKYWYKLGSVKICTHDPLVDEVISDHLHRWSFWGSPDEWMVLLASGPCTAERPYMLDIGSNLGVFSLIGAERGCHALAFEPLSENIQRVYQSIEANGYEGRIMLAQHAVGKYFTDVSVGFRPSNPGASGINLGGSKSETVQQVTIDGMLLGKNPPAFPDAKEKGLPPLLGQYINFVKVDTEGYDVAVVHGMMRTFVEGKVPLMLIEFGPGDAEGTAGCTSADFVDVMYENGYSLWEWGYRVPLEVLKFDNIPAAINGTGRRVFESWFIRDDFVESISYIAGDGRRKLKSEAA